MKGRGPRRRRRDRQESKPSDSFRPVDGPRPGADHVSRNWQIVLPIVCVALVIRLHQLGWGLPFVYEEAIPLKKAWEMWRWGTSAGVSFDPHFFNYPSLTIYLHFLAQGLLFLVMKLSGLIGSGAEYSARFLVDPTPFYVAGRSLSVLFGVGTVGLTYSIGGRIAGRFAGAASALLLAVNTYHIGRSQQIEVDVPLTFFAALSLLLVLRWLDHPSTKWATLSGVAIGLAASTKYTGAVLVLPLISAYFAALWTKRSGSLWWHPLLAIAAALLVLFATSPYIILNFAEFLKDVTYERQHLRLGHFGLDVSGGG